jgi:uncharacterized membrane protein YbhN (UPF0104 family)
MQLKQLKNFLLPLLGLSLFCLSIWAIGQELRHYSYEDILNSLKNSSIKSLLLALLFTILNYLVLTTYDVLACQYIRHPLPYPKVALVAVTSYGISNSVGFALFTGSAIRYRLYIPWGLTTIEVAKIIAFSNLSFWLGLSAVGGVLFLREPLTIPKIIDLPFDLPFINVYPFGLLLIVATCTYFCASLLLKRKAIRIGSKSFFLPSPTTAFAQILISSIDWSFAAAILYVLLPSSSISFIEFSSIYLLGQITGLVSNIPGGLGVFETILLLMLSPTIPTTKIFAALLLYRLIYFFIPLLISLLLLALYEIRQRKSFNQNFESNHVRRNKTEL